MNKLKCIDFISVNKNKHLVKALKMYHLIITYTIYNNHSRLKLFRTLCCYRYKSTDIIKYII